MAESDTARNNASPKTRKVYLQERAIAAGNVMGINGYRINRTKLCDTLFERGYQLHEKPHFLLFTRAEPPTTIIVHWFTPEEIDADIGDYMMQELKPLGVLVQWQDFANVISAIVCSLFPRDPLCAWHLYAKKTLQRYHHILNSESEVILSESAIDTFAKVYRRVYKLQTGKSFLDVGCSFGFLPLLIAEHFGFDQVVGVDIQADSFAVVRAIAEEWHLANVWFEQADLLADNFHEIGKFDTVAALHILEHIREEDMYCALTNLLKVTSQRLLIAVPYEPGEPEAAYGHEQLFTPFKLASVGQWCLQQLQHLGGAGRVVCEECAGGLLLIEKYPQSKEAEFLEERHSVVG